MDLGESVEKLFLRRSVFSSSLYFRPRSELRDRCFFLSFFFLPKAKRSPLSFARCSSMLAKETLARFWLDDRNRNAEGTFFPSPPLPPPSNNRGRWFFTRVSLENRTIVKRRLGCRLIPLQNVFTPVHTYKTSSEFNHYIHIREKRFSRFLITHSIYIYIFIIESKSIYYTYL